MAKITCDQMQKWASVPDGFTLTLDNFKTLAKTAHPVESEFTGPGEMSSICVFNKDHANYKIFFYIDTHKPEEVMHIAKADSLAQHPGGMFSSNDSHNIAGTEVSGQVFVAGEACDVPVITL